MKKILLSFLTLILLTSTAFADVKYTEKIGTDLSAMIPPNMPPEAMAMMQQMSGMGSQTITTYIKDTRERVDNSSSNTSTITMCDKRQTVELDHKSKTYKIDSMDSYLTDMDMICNPQTLDMPDQMPKPKGKLVIKTKITDTNKVENINGYQAHKYIKEFSVNGDSTCMPNMSNKQEIWVASNVNIPQMNCPLIKYPNCKLPVVAMPPCYKNATIINEGLSDIPPFIIKTITIIDTPLNAMDEANAAENAMDEVTDDAGEFTSANIGTNMFQFSRASRPTMSTVSELISISYDDLPQWLFEIPADYANIMP